MRNASRPRIASVETRSKNAMSSSMLIRGVSSRNQLVAATFGHQNRRSGGVFLDLLPQTVNMSLERVGRDAGIVAPHFLEQDFARYRALPGAIEVAQDRGLLLGEADLVALRVDEQFGTRPERIGADGKHRVLARLVLAQLGADAREQHGEAERFRHVVVGAGLEAEDRVRVGIVA